MKSCLHRKCSPFDDDRLVEVCLTLGKKMFKSYFDIPNVIIT